MKRNLLTLLAGGAILSLSAAVTAPISFESDFSTTLTVPSSWIQMGVDGVVGEPYTQKYSTYSPTNCFRVMGWSTGAAAFTPATMQTADGVAIPSDQWLITPEFEVKEDIEMLTFLVAANGNTAKNYFVAYVSTEGATKEDFLKNPMLTATLIGASNSVNTTTRRVVLEGYAGKKVRVALVSAGNTSGQMGFNNVEVGPYYIKIANAVQLENYVVDGDDIKLPVQVRISTPVSCTGFTAKLETSDGFVSLYENKSVFSKSKISSVNFLFPDAINFPSDRTDYTITITPNMEGVTPTVITGTFIKAPAIYQANALVEEITGCWCGWCPRGIAFMNYYKDKFNNSSENGKVIPLMLHNGDKMDIDLPYIQSVVNVMVDLFGEYGFPMVLVNRNGGGDPGEADVAGVVTSKSYGKLNILGVKYDPEDSKNITVRCGNWLSFSAPDAGVSVAAVVLENNVKGNSNDWDQTDYYGKYGMSAMVQNYGSEVAPYFMNFVNRPNGVVPYNEIAYPDVARSIYPSYKGEEIEGAWEADVRRDYDLNFVLPNNIMNIENCAIAAMLIKNSTGEIIGSDIMEYADWSKELSGVNTLGASTLSMRATKAAEGLALHLSDDANVVVCGLDGSLLFNGRVSAGDNVLALPQGRVVVVKATSAEGTMTSKVML